MQTWQRRTMVGWLILEALLIGHPRHRWADLSNYFGHELPLVLSELTKPGGGERVLPGPVQSMLALLRTHRIDSYRISDEIAGDPLLSQRIMESAWPIRRSAMASWYLAFATKALPDSCLPADRNGDIVLAHCP